MKATLWAWGILLGLSLPTIAGAAGNYSAEEAFRDPNTGAIYYNVTRTDDKGFDQRVVVKTTDGQWKQWDEKIRRIVTGAEQNEPLLDTTYQDSVLGGMQYAFDPNDQEVVKGKWFEPSPNGEWGLHQRRYTVTGEQGGRKAVYSYLLKNNKTGATKEWLRTNQYAQATWLHDNRIVYSHISEKAKQEEILVYNPANGKTERVVLGNLKGIHPESGLIVYSENKPERPLFLYDLSKGVSKPIKDWAEAETYLPKPAEARDATADLPEDFDLDAIPVEKLPVKVRAAYTVVLDEAKVGVPVAFEEQGQMRIPLKPLAESLGWGIAKLQAKAPDYRFKVTNGSKSVVLNSGNSLLQEGALYITPEIIGKLGYKSVQVQEVKS
ncbi:hypothetical protein ABD76_15230 [Paenibacillus dendritiformis]|uniref:hypothetical protein n=1 Tax=Paenibacillus dendritiformis TaxID=130049 RepID=UPI0018CC8833|nr:hypothetical protein [Paenibacillus dendritiformis]MBG9793783.1 hypothetical protein [Paenibacillus dendritiformis]